MKKLVTISLETLKECSFCDHNSQADIEIDICIDDINAKRIHVCEKHFVQMYKDFEDAMKEYIKIKQSLLDKNFESEKQRLNNLSKELFDDNKKASHCD